jgi:hypothetical protein
MLHLFAPTGISEAGIANDPPVANVQEIARDEVWLGMLGTAYIIHPPDQGDRR